MSDCCVLGYAPYVENRVLHEGDNFYVCAGLGAMGIEGYLMVVSKEHYVSAGELSLNQQKEFDSMIRLAKAKILEVYNEKSIVFIHGLKVGNCGWGVCIDHLHAQICPKVNIERRFAVSLMDNLKESEKFYRVDRVEGFKRIGEIFEAGKTSYVMLETQDAKRLVSEVSFRGPSQWMRRLIAEEIDKPLDWNWRLREDRETAMRTVERMQGIF